MMLVIDGEQAVWYNDVSELLYISKGDCRGCYCF